MLRRIKRNADPSTLRAFQGIYSMDELPQAIKYYPCLMIINTQAHNLDGEHWIAVHIGKHRRGEIFDSLVTPLPNILLRWLNSFSVSYIKNHRQFQHPMSSTCGGYVLYYVLNRLKDSNCMDKYFNASLPLNEMKVLRFYANLE